MKLIRSSGWFEPRKPNGSDMVYMLGYGGRKEYAKRHINGLLAKGYRLYVIDFEMFFGEAEPVDILKVFDEVEDLLKAEDLLHKDVVIVGTSLGALAGYNILRRHESMKKLFCITGGDITKIPSTKMALRKRWRNLSTQDLEELWAPINIYTDRGGLKGKEVIMLLPKKDKIIDPKDVVKEFNKHKNQNKFSLIWVKGGHFRAIIRETMFRPKKTVKMIDRFAKS